MWTRSVTEIHVRSYKHEPLFLMGVDVLIDESFSAIDSINKTILHLLHNSLVQISFVRACT